MYEYKVDWCPICDQGWVEIVKDTVTNEIHLMCRECDSMWDDPEDVGEYSNRSVHNDNLVKKPTSEEIQLKNWTKYIMNDE